MPAPQPATEQGSPAVAAAVTAVCLAVVGALGVVAWTDRTLTDAGRADLVQLTDPGNLVLLVAGLFSVSVGGLLALRRPRHPVGWLLLALGTSIPVSGASAGLALRAMTTSDGAPSDASRAAALVADQVPVAWHVLLTLILLLTPHERLRSRWQQLTAWASGVSGLLLYVALTVSTAPLDPPFATVTSPFAVQSLAPPVAAVRGVALSVLLLTVLAAAAGLVFRASRGDEQERRQLSWMVVAAPPAAALMLTAAVASLRGAEVVLGLSAGAFLGLVPVAVALAVTRHQLYDVPRLLSRTSSYVLLSLITALLYALGVLVAGLVLGSEAGSSQSAAVMATLASISVAWPLRGRLQDAVDRRFGRRRFAAREVVRQYVSAPSTGTTVEEMLRTATGDASLAVAYPLDDRWVSEDGHAAGEPGPLALTRRGAPVARISWNTSEEAVVRAASEEAVTELDAARLRAALAVQLVDVRASRARIVEAQAAERRRIERDLHDGVQQRLLALALRLRLGVPGRDAMDEAVVEIQHLLHDLRSLANGLQPALLKDGGLPAALDDLAARLPMEVDLRVPVRRFAGDVEATAWFIACEAVANAVKHAAAASLRICVEEREQTLVVTVDDDGSGGADAAGSGLRGIADRAEAAGGRLHVGRSPAGGTRVQGVLPCGS